MSEKDARETEHRGAMDFDLKSREVTEERVFITMEGEEFEMGPALSLLDKVRDTDGLVSHVVPEYNKREFADFLLEHDVVGRRASGAIFDRGGCGDLHDAIEHWYIEKYVEGDDDR